MEAIPSHMQALRLTKPGKVEVQQIPVPKLKEGEVLVKMHASAFNKRDHWIQAGSYPNIEAPCTLGADGCGMVMKAEGQAGQPWVGKSVVINPAKNWGPCKECFSPDFTILGMPEDGTLAEFMAIPVDRLAPKPAHLSEEQAAAVPLAGLTAFRAVFTQGGLPKKGAQGTRVLVTGAGGGVQTFVTQFALSTGAEVYVTTGSEAKLQRCLEMGANGGVNYHDQDWPQKLTEKLGKGKLFNLIIDSAGGESFTKATKLLDFGGRLAVYGATIGVCRELDLWDLFWKQARIQGSTMGTDAEFGEMLSFLAEAKLCPITDSIRPFDQAPQALHDLAHKQDFFGKIVVTFPK